VRVRDIRSYRQKRCNDIYAVYIPNIEYIIFALMKFLTVNSLL